VSEHSEDLVPGAVSAECRDDARCAFCDRCGSPVDLGQHDRCAGRRELEPPRFCPDCGRRMVVQVTPSGWTARCSRHGERRG
jgi:hypothetical protein